MVMGTPEGAEPSQSAVTPIGVAVPMETAPGSGTLSSIAPPAPAAEEEQASAGKIDDAWRKADWIRKLLAVVCGFSGFGIAGFVAFDTFIDLRHPVIANNQFEQTLGLARLGAHALVAVALVFFAYQLLRVAERLGVPSVLLRPENVEVVRVILGVKVPTAELVKAIKGATEALEKLAKR